MATVDKSKKTKKQSLDKIKKPKRSKNISLGVVHILSSFNNTIVTVTDVQGNALATASAGSVGFSGPKKSSPHAAQVCIEKAANDAKLHGLKTVSIRIQGPGSQRDSALRAVFAQNFTVTGILDVTCIPHNGCKPPKMRRV